MEPTEQKPWWQSTTYISLAVKVVGVALMLAGVTGDDATEILNSTQAIIGAVVTIVGAGGVIFGHFKTRKKVAVLTDAVNK